jgi:tRNA pseudouridine38-40 synthase
VTGAGRTDAGVHARMMVAHFDVESLPMAPDDLVYKLNRLLPQDIAIQAIRPVAPEMHARFSATSRTYHYYISTKRNPFNRQYTWLCHYDLDFELMNQAAEILLEYKDFASFCKSHTDVKTTLCNIIEAKWIKEDDEGCYYFRIKANRFLRNMVRAVVGTLVEVGRHRLSLDDFRNVIEGKKRTMAGESMPANALFLEKIEY